jgi:uncharacterized protein
MTKSERAMGFDPAASSLAVFDTSPLILLDTLGFLPALRDMRGAILIPEEVSRELVRQPGKPASIAPDLEWVEVRSAPEYLISRVVKGAPAMDSGEREAIALALAERSTLVIDDLKGRQRGRRLGLSVSGTIGELVALRSLGFTAVYSRRSPEEDLEMLHNAGMRLTDELWSRVLRELANTD